MSKTKFTEEQTDAILCLCQFLPTIPNRGWVTIDPLTGEQDVTLWSRKPKPDTKGQYWKEPTTTDDRTWTSLASGGFDPWELLDLVRDIHDTGVDVMSFRLVTELGSDSGWTVEEVARGK